MAIKQYTTQNTFVCTASQIKLDDVPEEIKILPLGMVYNTHTDFMVDDESCRLIIEQFKNRNIDLVIDYEHQTLTDMQAPAGGWIKDIWKGTDALIAKVEWTQKARNYLQNKEYRYLSPVVTVRKTDGKAVALHSVALTNTPAINGMFAVVNSAGFSAADNITINNKGGKDIMDITKLTELLGLPAEAAEEEILKAINALVKSEAETKQEKKAEEVVANSTILTMLGLKDDAKTEDVAGKIQQLQNGGPAVAVELAALKQSLAKKDADAAVAEALNDGKITAAQKEWAETYALKDPEGFRGFCDKATPVVPMGKISYKDVPGTGKDAVEVSAEILKNMGLTRKDLETYTGEEE